MASRGTLLSTYLAELTVAMSSLPVHTTLDDSAMTGLLERRCALVDDTTKAMKKLSVDQSTMTTMTSSPFTGSWDESSKTTTTRNHLEHSSSTTSASSKRLSPRLDRLLSLPNRLGAETFSTGYVSDVRNIGHESISPKHSTNSSRMKIS